MFYEVTTKYKQEFLQWLNSEHAAQRLGNAESFNWQWFITMTSKDTMTRNGARLAITRFLGLYLQETKTDEVTCFWVTEPHNQGKDGYHVHALLQTKWPMPKESKRVHNLALMLDDVYQRAMGVIPSGIDYQGKQIYKTRHGKVTSKHRFRAESYSKARGEYCAKYITKGASDWEFARVTSETLQCNGNVFEEQSSVFVEGSPEDSLKDCKGNWNKKAARLRTRHEKMRRSLATGEKLLHLKQLKEGAELEYAKLIKFTHSQSTLELTTMQKVGSANIFY